MEPHRIVHYPSDKKTSQGAEVALGKSHTSQEAIDADTLAEDALYEARRTAERCTWVGFDLDHALARYKLRELLPLVYDALAEYLVEVNKWPRRRLHRGESWNDTQGATHEVQWRPEFIEKGIIFEFETGNLLKLNENGVVSRAAHGERFLTDEEIAECYGESATWKHFQELQQQRKHPDFFVFLTYFDISAQLLLARMVDVVDDGEFKNVKTYYDLGPHIFGAFNHIFDNVSGFAEKRGLFFRRLLSNPAQYIHRRPRLREWIMRERKANRRRFFIVTNSHSKFASFTLTHSLGEDWGQLFDIVFVNAKKPRWFHEPANAYMLDTTQSEEGRVATQIELNRRSETTSIYCQGCYLHVECFRGATAGVAYLNDSGRPYKVGSSSSEAPGSSHDSREATARHEISDSVADSIVDANVPGGLSDMFRAAKNSSDVMYVGDHIHGDVVPARKLRKWISVAIVEELRETFPRFASEYSTIHEVHRPRRESSDFQENNEDNTFPSELGFSGAWGGFFVVRSSTKQSQRTYFCSLLEKYGSFALSDAENLPDLFSTERS
eukprot:gb/GECG01006278.1/.p1 GENE.gb/GECG01006278.1/~~gb/GECG01006278.1/.p1  ORF type:complete len:553 (+),score=63.54 gb/GECG01006278.1/:1-1659(+)